MKNELITIEDYSLKACRDEANLKILEKDPEHEAEISVERHFTMEEKLELATRLNKFDSDFVWRAHQGNSLLAKYSEKRKNEELAWLQKEIEEEEE